MEPKSDREILNQGYKIIERGDGYRTLYSFIKKHRDKEEEVNILIQKIKEMDNKMNLTPNIKSKKINPYSFVIGASIIILGISTFVTWWEKGALLVFPIILVGLGVNFLAKQIHHS